MQQLGHLLVVGMVLPSGPAGHKPIVLELGYVLVREALHAKNNSDADVEDAHNDASNDVSNDDNADNEQSQVIRVSH